MGLSGNLNGPCHTNTFCSSLSHFGFLGGNEVDGKGFRLGLSSKIFYNIATVTTIHNVLVFKYDGVSFAPL